MEGEILGSIDLGHNHSIRYTSWRPDRELSPGRYDHLPDVERFGLLVEHRAPDGSPCLGSVTFEGAVASEVFPGRATWTVESWNPLTLSPSLLCSCGDHGFIREGRWVPA